MMLQDGTWNRYLHEVDEECHREVEQAVRRIMEKEGVDEQLKAYFSEISDEDQVIVCTDLMGGSVNQKIVPYAQKKNVFLIAGFNLPLLLELAMNEDKVTEEELLDSIEESRKNMMLVRVEVTDSGTKEEEEEFLA